MFNFSERPALQVKKRGYRSPDFFLFEEEKWKKKASMNFETEIIIHGFWVKTFRMVNPTVLARV